MKNITLGLVALIAFGAIASAAEVIPPKPDRYFVDYANVVSKEAALRFNEQLAQFERDTSNQVLVAVFPKMQSDSSIEDYTQRIFDSWRPGRADKDNGAVLFVFVGDRKMYLKTGYGLEGALPDATAFDITERHIKPRFRQNDYEGGLAIGIDLILKAIRGEYKGTGKTRAESGAKGADGGGFRLPRPTLLAAGLIVALLIIFFVMFLIWRSTKRRGYGYSHSGGPVIWGGSPWSSGSSGSSGGWSSGGGGFSSFSGGGGMSGGGGAGSSW